MSMRCFTGILPITEAHVRLHFVEGPPRPLPKWPLMALRGLQGTALLRLLHGRVDRPPPGSPYWRIFKPGNGAPTPLLLDVPEGGISAEGLEAVLRFWGSGREWMELCVNALAASGPFAYEGAPYRLEVVRRVRRTAPPWSEGWQASGARAWDVTFATPLQLNDQNKRQSDGTLRDAQLLRGLLKAAVRRLEGMGRGPKHVPGSGLAERYGGGITVDTDIVNGLCKAARIVERETRHEDAWRVSGETGQRIYVGGLCGRVRVVGPPEVERLLRTAVLTGVASSTAEMCGRVRVTPLREEGDR